MSTRIGIHVQADFMRAVVVVGSRVVAFASRERESSDSIGTDVRGLLLALPDPYRNTSVRVAMEPPDAISRRITDLPPIEDAGNLAQSVVENADRYFIAGDLSRCLAVKVTPGAVLADGFTRSVVEDLAAVAAESRLKHLAVIAASSLRNGNLLSSEPGYEIAQAAALAQLRDVPSVMVGERSTRAIRSRAGAVAAVAAGLLLLAAPVLQSRRIAAAASAGLEAIAVEHRRAARTRSELERLRGQIERAHIERGTRSATGLLADLVRVLPGNTSILALSLDSLKGSAVILSASVADALPALDSIATIEDVRLSGPVTRERVAEREIERATVLFTWRSR